jgi:ketosteroid isomerase-like protein
VFSVDDFLADVLPRHTHAAEALHNGDAGPMTEMLAEQEPLSLFPGMADHRTKRDDILSTFSAVAARFTDSTPLTFELIAADVSGDCGYVVGCEHSTVSIADGPLVRNDLRVTHIYRRKHGTWRLVHRHGGGGPSRD